MKRILVALLTMFAMANASGSCDLSVNGDVDVTWKAFKTPAKVGVGGHFTSVDYKSTVPKAKNFRDLFVGSKMVIDVGSVDSKNPGRDAKLLKSFFNVMVGPDIKAEVVDIKAQKVERGTPKLGVITIAVTMNGVTKDVPMNYRYFDSKLAATGAIDIFDFQGQDALTSINKACFDLHQGKTWSDVEIGFAMDIKAVCLPE